MIAMRLQFRNFEDMFLAGLLHDIGIILEDQHAHEPFTEAIESLATGTTLCKMEKKYIGFDHTQLGDRVAELSPKGWSKLGRIYINFEMAIVR